jgi:formiminoglutamase
VKFPVLISLPHAGLDIPEEVQSLVLLDEDEIRRDADEQAAEIYGPLESLAAAFVTTDIARAFVDLNRAEDDRGADGVVKTHTIFNVPVYDKPLAGDVIEILLARYYRPYHARLTEIASGGKVRVGIDCHTMLEVAPPIGPDPGTPRPAVCLGNLDGRTCPESWLDDLAAAFESALGLPVAKNDPFKGGLITRSHSSEIPWIQLEISRGDFLDINKKSRAVRMALGEWVCFL